MRFVLDLAANIENIQICSMQFSDLVEQYQLNDVIFKEHPLNAHYSGREEPRIGCLMYMGTIHHSLNFGMPAGNP